MASAWKSDYHKYGGPELDSSDDDYEDDFSEAPEPMEHWREWICEQLSQYDIEPFPELPRGVVMAGHAARNEFLPHLRTILTTAEDFNLVRCIGYYFSGDKKYLCYGADTPCMKNWFHRIIRALVRSAPGNRQIAIGQLINQQGLIEPRRPLENPSAFDEVLQVVAKRCLIPLYVIRDCKVDKFDIEGSEFPVPGMAIWLEQTPGKDGWPHFEVAKLVRPTFPRPTVTNQPSSGGPSNAVPVDLTLEGSPSEAFFANLMENRSSGAPRISRYQAELNLRDEFYVTRVHRDLVPTVPRTDSSSK